MTSTIKVNTITKKCGSTLTLGESGTTITLACGATQSGFGRTGTVDWCTTAKTSPLTGVSGNGYFINTTAGAITVTLPSSPTAGDIIALKDYAGTWDDNNVTLGRGGSKINGICACATLSTQSQSVTLVYVDGTKGWQDIHDSTSSVTGEAFISASGGNATLTCGNYKTHVFTADGCFAVSSIGSPANNKLEYLVVAGGGSAGGYYGAGGAGGFRYYTSLDPAGSPLNAPAGVCASVSTYPISVGAGGAANPSAPGIGAYKGNNGSNSTGVGITSTGGGYGNAEPAPTGQGGPGGSGGSSGYDRPPSGQGTGNTPPTSPPQGNPAGRGSYGTAGGGGGAGGAGSNGTCNGLSDCSPHGGPQIGGAGGVGSYIPDGFIKTACAPTYGTPGPVSSTRYFAGGGAAGSCSGTTGSAGAGGGGIGKNNSGPFPSDQNGDANTGGGGGASGGGTGGSGIVMVRYRYQ